MKKTRNYNKKNRVIKQLELSKKRVKKQQQKKFIAENIEKILLHLIFSFLQSRIKKQIENPIQNTEFKFPKALSYYIENYIPKIDNSSNFIFGIEKQPLLPAATTTFTSGNK